MARRRYEVVFERGDRPGQWVASVKGIPECHTFGRGLAQTRVRIREALILWEGEVAKNAEIGEILPVPDVVRRIKSRIVDLDREWERVLVERDAVVASLRRADWSLRDIADLFALSHQRVGQVAPRRSRRVPRSRVRSK